MGRTHEHDDAMRETEDEERRIQRKMKRLAKKQVKLLDELGYDEHGEKIETLSSLDKPVREWQFKLPGSVVPVALNPVVTLIAVLTLWGVVIWSSLNTTVALDTIIAWRGNITLTCTWLFQGTRAIFFFFLVYITYRYGHIHLGQKGEEPAFSTMSYIAMITTCGVATGLYMYCMEALWHDESHYFAQAGYRSQDELAMFGINLVVVHWGIAGWGPYTIVAVGMALATHKFRLPPTLRSCFYPILGQYTWGWIGDVIDGLAIIVTVAGICTSLGLGGIQMVGGLEYMGWIDPENTSVDMTRIYTLTIWFFTIISTVSVLTGLHGGIQVLSFAAMALGSTLLLLVLALDDTKFLLNLQVQEVGYYLQHSILELNFLTDAFGQLREGSGRAVDGKAAEDWWMDAWMVFYQAWWTAWAIFVGMFVACISRGRKLWEVVMYTMVLPVALCTIWFTTWGGIGVRQARQAKELEVLGETYYNNSGHFLVDGSEFCYDVPQEDVLVNATVIFTNYLLGVSPVCQFDSDNSNTAPYNVLHSFHLSDGANGGIGPFLSIVFFLGTALFFVTSSDSATFVVDMLASNGRQNQHWARQSFWAATMGALASALLSSGGAEALKAVQAASIVCAVPVVILMCYMLQCIHLFCVAGDKVNRELDYPFPTGSEFTMPIYGGVLNIAEYLLSWGQVHPLRVQLGMDLPTKLQVRECAKGLFLPFVSLHQVLKSTYPKSPRMRSAVVGCYSACFVGWVGISLSSATHPGMHGLKWVLFILAGCILGLVRSTFRSKHRLRSNTIADLTSALFFWPQVLTQMRVQSVEPVSFGSSSEDQMTIETASTPVKLKMQPDKGGQDIINISLRKAIRISEPVHLTTI